ncbi:MAG: VOC family protein [Candidatus Dormiibacterota bacterium]
MNSREVAPAGETCGHMLSSVGAAEVVPAPLSEGANYNFGVLRCTPFLLFDGNCAEAMTFYHRCLGGELTLTRLGESQMRDQLPLEKHERIINAHLESGDIEISATDWMAAPDFMPVQGNMCALFVVGEGRDELNAVFDKLAEGADRERFQDLHDLPIGTYGQFSDRFGVHWIFLNSRTD